MIKISINRVTWHGFFNKLKTATPHDDGNTIQHFDWTISCTETTEHCRHNCTGRGRARLFSKLYNSSILINHPQADLEYLNKLCMTVTVTVTVTVILERKGRGLPPWSCQHQCVESAVLLNTLSVPVTVPVALTYSWFAQLGTDHSGENRLGGHCLHIQAYNTFSVTRASVTQADRDCDRDERDNIKGICSQDSLQDHGHGHGHGRSRIDDPGLLPS